MNMYNFKNEPVSSITHLVGASLSIIGLVFLVIISALKGNVWHIISFSIFGAALVLLYLASTLYHFFDINTKAKNVFRRIDHSMIYVLIAATYTPVCLTALRGVWGWSILVVIWTIAITGISLKSSGVMMKGGLSMISYILMGWVIVIAIFPLSKIIPLSNILWLLLGGIFYTIGASFFYFEKEEQKKIWGPHETFHIFVILGSVAHYVFVIKYLI